MSNHGLTVTIERGGFVRTKAHCNAPDDAACRNMPTCQCESWDIQKDNQGWFHTVGAEPGDVPDEVVYHRHTEPSDCNVCEWLNADDPLECLANSTKSFDIARVPIRPEWTGDYYTWEPMS